MARPLKKGLGYFPLDTDFLSDRKIQRLSQKYGCKGVCTYLAVLCEIYGGNGYYVNYDTDFCFDIGFTLHLSEDEVRDVIGYCVQVRLFDSGLFDSLHILSSVAIQQRYREIYRRNRPRIDPELLLLVEEKTFEGVSVAETEVIAAETPVRVTETPVSEAITPSKGKGNKKEKETINTTFDEESERYPSDNGASARRAELLRMAAVATAGC